MNLRQLEVFFAIMQSSSVTGAARNLNISQPAVSAVLKHTEQQLKMKLFERIGGRLYPTPEAEAILPDIQEIFGRVDTVSRMVEGLRDGRAGRIVIATSPTLIDSYFPSALGAFRRASPHVQVSLLSLPTHLARDRVSRREADFGLVYGPVTDPGLEMLPLVSTYIACALKHDHPLASKEFITFDDLVDEPVISLAKTTILGGMIEKECHRSGAQSLRIAIEASSCLTACLLASEGIGIALVANVTSGIIAKFTELVFRPFCPHMAVPIQLIYPKDRPRSRVTQQFSDIFREVSAKDPNA